MTLKKDTTITVIGPDGVDRSVSGPLGTIDHAIDKATAALQAHSASPAGQLRIDGALLHQLVAAAIPHTNLKKDAETNSTIRITCDPQADYRIQLEAATGSSSIVIASESSDKIEPIAPFRAEISSHDLREAARLFKPGRDESITILIKTSSHSVRFSDDSGLFPDHDLALQVRNLDEQNPARDTSQIRDVRNICAGAALASLTRSDYFRTGQANLRPFIYTATALDCELEFELRPRMLVVRGGTTSGEIVFIGLAASRLEETSAPTSLPRAYWAQLLQQHLNGVAS